MLYLLSISGLVIGLLFHIFLFSPYSCGCSSFLGWLAFHFPCLVFLCSYSLGLVINYSSFLFILGFLEAKVKGHTQSSLLLDLTSFQPPLHSLQLSPHPLSLTILCWDYYWSFVTRDAKIKGGKEW